MRGNRRKWFRFRIPPGNDQAVLCAGGKEHLVQLENSSAGGFAAVGEKPLKVAIGQVLPLETSCGWLEVRVVRLQDRGGAVHLGLERVRDLERGPRRTLLSALGGGIGLIMLALAALAGLVVGGSILYRGTWPALVSWW